MVKTTSPKTMSKNTVKKTVNKKSDKKDSKKPFVHKVKMNKEGVKVVETKRGAEVTETHCRKDFLKMLRFAQTDVSQLSAFTNGSKSKAALKKKANLAKIAGLLQESRELFNEVFS